jgi:hypothetical protein
VDTCTLVARFKATDPIQKLVFSPDGSRFAALTHTGLELFDAINKHKIADPKHEEISWTLRNGTLISEPDREFVSHGKPLLGHFPEHRGGVPILWMPHDVGISELIVESSIFALGCDDGRLMIGRVPHALDI